MLLINVLVKLKEKPNKKVLGLFEGCEINYAVLGQAAKLKLATKEVPYDIILLEGNGLDTLRTIKGADPRAEVVIIGKATAKAVESVKEGASAYFERPLDMKAFKNTVDHILELIRLRQETGKLENILSSKYTYHGIVGKNPQILEIKNFIRRIAPYYRAVTISGELGVGKEAVARAIHSEGLSPEDSFVVYDCSAVTEQTIERELFGVCPSQDGQNGEEASQGIFVEAGRGTVVLDNIEYLPQQAQGLLASIIKDGEFIRVGSGLRISAQCRVITLTEKDPAGDVLKGLLTPEFYECITDLSISLPPLRARKDDLLLLTRFFLKNQTEQTGKRISGASMPVQNLFMKYDWPGNVTELKELIERVAAATNDTFIGLDDLPKHFARLAEEDASSSLSLDDVIRGHIRMVYDLSRQNIDEAAEQLGIRPSALKKKLESYSLL